MADKVHRGDNSVGERTFDGKFQWGKGGREDSDLSGGGIKQC